MKVKVGGVILTWIARDEARLHRDRRGFTPVCQYGNNMPVEECELGAITFAAGEAKPVPGLALWAIPVRVAERIFIVEPT